MRLINAHVTEFRSINDSTEFEIGDVTCLVGKNESGKTALLKALYKLNPIIEEDGHFDVTDDYPRCDVSDYEDEVESEARSPATVIRAMFALEVDDISAVESVYGKKCFASKEPRVSLSKGYENKRSFGELELNDKPVLQHLVQSHDLPSTISAELKNADSAQTMCDVLQESEQTEPVQQLLKQLEPIAKDGGLRSVVYNDILKQRMPKFLYFDDYYQMKGQDNIEALQKRVASQTLKKSDHPLLGLIKLARLDLKHLTDPGRTESLISKLEAAENQLTAKVLTYWSQNTHLRLKFDIRPAQPKDPEGMTKGTNIWGRVVDTKHSVTTPLRTRSRGFVWFFSFLAWYSQQKNENLILLLDEPGLSLHAKAQADLLNYFENELRPRHQLIYSTHSPFLVDSTRFDQIRIVQDLSIESGDDELPKEQQGTKVTTDVLEATPDSLFPLQGALGYEISQTLFIGKHSLVVEGVSDLIYFQTMSAFLQEKGRIGLSSEWTITPVGGADKVPTFVALIGAQKNLNIAVLIDYQKKDQQMIKNLYREKLLEKNKINTFAEFVTANEADIEDMFDIDFYLKLVNAEFSAELSKKISISDLDKHLPRISVRLERYFKDNPLNENSSFNHYRPARYLAENLGSLRKSISDDTLDRFEAVFKHLNTLL